MKQVLSGKTKTTTVIYSILFFTSIFSLIIRIWRGYAFDDYFYVTLKIVVVSIVYIVINTVYMFIIARRHLQYSSGIKSGHQFNIMFRGVVHNILLYGMFYAYYVICKDLFYLVHFISIYFYGAISLCNLGAKKFILFEKGDKLFLKIRKNNDVLLYGLTYDEVYVEDFGYVIRLGPPTEPNSAVEPNQAFRSESSS